MKPRFLVLACLLTISCHSVVYFPHRVRNLSQDTLVVAGKPLSISYNLWEPDTAYLIPPKTSQTIRFSRYYCWFGDCRGTASREKWLDTLQLQQYRPNGIPIPVSREGWKIRRKRAILTVRGVENR